MNSPPHPSKLPRRLLLFAAALLLPVAAGAGHRTKVNGHRVYYLRAGTGSPVVLLHGRGNAGEHDFQNQIDRLIDAGHELIAPDQVGQGHAPELLGALRYDPMMEDTAALLRVLGVMSNDMIAFSHGGILGLMFAIGYPELVNRLVVSGATISPAGLPQDHLDAL
ncbi:alpha/beta hydrolase [uncultured Thiodictyon sp.]|uniref:alpha/beta fold hydrolase n=1 Tax=uncultured Thiodictyon sp. TaxID=1846217 RepID=UPI0025E06744|nr:alpha/beta hydrolase [uncultured Thiodictyon sp.]